MKWPYCGFHIKTCRAVLTRCKKRYQEPMRTLSGHRISTQRWRATWRRCSKRLLVSSHRQQCRLLARTSQDIHHHPPPTMQIRSREGAGLHQRRRSSLALTGGREIPLTHSARVRQWEVDLVSCPWFRHSGIDLNRRTSNSNRTCRNSTQQCHHCGKKLLPYRKTTLTCMKSRVTYQHTAEPRKPRRLLHTPLDRKVAPSR